MMNATTSSRFIPKRLKEFIDNRGFAENETEKVMGESTLKLTGGVSLRKTGKDSSLIKGGDFQKRAGQTTRQEYQTMFKQRTAVFRPNMRKTQLLPKPK